MRGFPNQPQSAGSELRGSAVQQQAVPGRILLGASFAPDTSHQAPGLDLAADHRAGSGRGDFRRRKEDPACPTLEPRSAPQRQQDSTLPSSGGSHLRDLERTEVKKTHEPGLKGRSAAGGAQEPNPRTMYSWTWHKLNSFSSSGKPPGESAGTSPPKHVKQSKAETRSNLIPETDKTLSKTNPLETGLMALRNSSHPQSSQFLQALERPIQIVNDLLDENQHLQKELKSSRALQERLQANVKQLQQELQKRQSSKGGLEYQLVAENRRLQWELQELRNTQGALLADLQAENQDLRQELEELQKGRIHESETSAEEIPVPQSIAFPVQVQSSGKTGGCEQQFLHDVAKILNSHNVSLQVEEYQESSEHLLLLFSPIASRTGADIDSALNGLKSIRKVLLVLFHHKLKSNTKVYAGTKTQVQHPALVGTVDACFSIQDGFYHCQMNHDAVESVAATIMQLTQDG